MKFANPLFWIGFIVCMLCRLFVAGTDSIAAGFIAAEQMFDDGSAGSP